MTQAPFSQLGRLGAEVLENPYVCQIRASANLGPQPHLGRRVKSKHGALWLPVDHYIRCPTHKSLEQPQNCITATEIELSNEDFDYLNQNLPAEAVVSSELTPKPGHRV